MTMRGRLCCMPRTSRRVFGVACLRQPSSYSWTSYQGQSGPYYRAIRTTSARRIEGPKKLSFSTRTDNRSNTEVAAASKGGTAWKLSLAAMVLGIGGFYWHSNEKAKEHDPRTVHNRGLQNEPDFLQRVKRTIGNAVQSSWVQPYMPDQIYPYVTMLLGHDAFDAEDGIEEIFTEEQINNAWEALRNPPQKLPVLSSDERTVFVCLNLIHWATKYQVAMVSLLSDQNRLEEVRFRILMCIELYQRGTEKGKRQASERDAALLKKWYSWLEEVEGLLRSQEEHRLRLQCNFGAGVAWGKNQNVKPVSRASADSAQTDPPKTSRDKLLAEGPKTLQSAGRMLIQCIESLQPAAPKMHRFFCLGGEQTDLVSSSQRVIYVAAPDTRKQIIQQVLPPVLSFIFRKLSEAQLNNSEVGAQDILRSMTTMPEDLRRYHLHQQAIGLKLGPIEEGLKTFSGTSADAQPALMSPTSHSKSRQLAMSTPHPGREALFLMEMTFSNREVNRLASVVFRQLDDVK
eukprot:gb/GECG01011297.1/.p1 GENE.gb/GECG01011297.1/~~gb/GECG01011297.1/.p1  ORF type:complete len:514 (+),score=58.61 gb/GECG01011297.1/:1-1542(+)